MSFLQVLLDKGYKDDENLPASDEVPLFIVVIFILYRFTFYL